MGVQEFLMEGSTVNLAKRHDFMEAVEVEVECGERGLWLWDKLRGGEGWGVARERL